MFPGNEDDFDFNLDEWKKNYERRFDHLKEQTYVPPPPPPKVELSLEQKRIVVDYVLGSVGKGIFEDVAEFWEGISDIEEAYPSYRQATEEFVDGLR